MPVGMNCGGLIAVKFAANFPELVSCLYVDAPVMNYMSCPCGFSIGNACCEDFPEIFDSLGQKSISDIICYLDMPMHRIPDLIKNKIPVILIAGDSDKIVPYEENGALLEKAYKENGLPIEVHIKKAALIIPTDSITQYRLLNLLKDILYIKFDIQKPFQLALKQIDCPDKLKKRFT